jgi:hypothetical protein
MAVYPISIVKHAIHIFPKELCVIIDNYLFSKEAINHIKLKSINKPIFGAIEEYNSEEMNPTDYENNVCDLTWKLTIFTIDCNKNGKNVIISQRYYGKDYSQNDLIELKKKSLELRTYNLQFLQTDMDQYDGKIHFKTSLRDLKLTNFDNVIGIVYNMYAASINMCEQYIPYDVYESQYLTDTLFEFNRCSCESEFYKKYQYKPRDPSEYNDIFYYREDYGRRRSQKFRLMPTASRYTPFHSAR